MESVILDTPLLIVLLAVAFFFCLYSLIKGNDRGFGLWAAAVIVVGAVTYALVLGASLTECGGVCLVFLLPFLIRAGKKGGEK